jgi:glycosyltransferase involved in cell wall biosynthesis
MRVDMVDPSAFTPPYDHALCAALARAGAEVELITSRFAHGPAPPGEGYAVRERFYRFAPGRPGSAARRAAKLAQHVPELLRYRPSGRAADVVHVQWLTIPALDARLLPRGRALVYTAHNALREHPGPGERRMYRRADAVVVHSEAAREHLAAEAGLDRDRLHVIAHGAFDYLTRLPEERPLPAELAAVQAPVALCFGLLRPYKAIDVLLEAWRGVGDAELWIVGAPRMDIRALRATSPPGVRWVARFVPDPELPAYLRRADLVVLPHRRVDQSGAAFAALAFGRPLLLTDVGGFRDLARAGAASLAPPDDPDALRSELIRLLEDRAARERLAQGSRAAAAGPFAWEAVGRRTLELYRSLVGER